MISYQKDFYGWLQEQGKFMRNHQFEKLDYENLLEEIEGMGRSEQRQLESRLSILLAHLLKWQYQPSLRSRSWISTIKEQRRKIARHLQENPSLKAKLENILIDAYFDAIAMAERETGISEENFASSCAYSVDEILNTDFFPK